MSFDGSLDATVGDDAVDLTFTVANDGTDPVELTFRNALTADFAVVDDGVERWRFSDGRMFAQMIQTRELPPGESMSQTATWDSPSPGDYEAVATLEANEVDVSARTTFSV